MAGPGRVERLWSGGVELYEAPDRGPYRNEYLSRHARRLVRGFRAGSEPADRLRMACLGIYARGIEWTAADRLPLSATDHLEQGPYGSYAHALLVSARALLVRKEEKRPVVWQGRRELDCLGFGIAQVHHGRLGRGEVRAAYAQAGRADAAADPQAHPAGRVGLCALFGQRHDARRGRTGRAGVLRPGTRSEVRRCGRTALAKPERQAGDVSRRRADVRCHGQ